MKACKCDVCGEYMDSMAVGVLYDNRLLHDNRRDRERFDLCPKCLLQILNLMDEMVVENANPVENNREY